MAISKKQRWRGVVAAAIAMLCLSGGSAQAGTILSITPAGGTGTLVGPPAIATTGPDVNDGNFFPGVETGGTVAFTQNRTGLGAFDVTVTTSNTDQTTPAGIAVPGSTTEYGFTITSNNTSSAGFGVYTFELVGAPPGASFDIPNGTPSPTGTGYAVASHTPTTITFAGSQLPGSPATFTFNVDIPNAGAFPGGTTFVIRQIAAVPEPSTYAMFGLGLIGMLAFARRRKSQVTAWAGNPVF